MLKKYLTREVFELLKERKTSYGSTLLDVIRSGLCNPDSHIGIYAADPEAYVVFKELFNPVIEEYHGFESSSSQPETNWGNPEELGNLDPDGAYIISTRVRCARSIEGYPFNPTMNETHYLDLEKKVSGVLESLTDDLKGQYYPLLGMSRETQDQLIEDHFLFKEGDRFLEAANSNRFWPKGRGIFFNDTKTFLVWCNEEDHLRLISMEEGGDLATIYGRLVDAVSRIEREISFSRNSRLGYLTFCPTNLGTTIRASVHIKLPRLGRDFEAFQEMARKFYLQVRGTRGEHTESEDGVYDISNQRRLGLTEFQALSEMRDGILQLIEQEKALEGTEQSP
ncbi:arginine kinase-like [Prorops nasuta]|uniref:arginine kinase-like n=1 Tax=Prorops nasuta TaxID=863751 RepID=UPI0034CFD3CA